VHSVDINHLVDIKRRTDLGPWNIWCKLLKIPIQNPRVPRPRTYAGFIRFYQLNSNRSGPAAFCFTYAGWAFWFIQTRGHNWPRDVARTKTFTEWEHNRFVSFFQHFASVFAYSEMDCPEAAHYIVRELFFLDSFTCQFMHFWKIESLRFPTRRRRPSSKEEIWAANLSHRTSKSCLRKNVILN
jgi:hypothetical protein